MSTWKRTIYLFVLALSLLITACQPVQPAPTAEPEVGLPNPASVYCEEQGGTLEMRQDASGGTYGVCIFEDGSECEEWTFFRGECAPGQQEEAEPPAQPAP